MAQNWQALFLVHMPLSKASHKAKAKPNIKEVGKTALPAFLNHGKGGGKEELWANNIIFHTQYSHEIKILDMYRNRSSNDHFPCTKAS